MNETFARQIGESYVTLDGGRTTCRAHECNLGNLVTDAMLAEQVTYMGDDGWTDVSIALMNSGGIRSSIGHGKFYIKRSLHKECPSFGIMVTQLLLLS